MSAPDLHHPEAPISLDAVMFSLNNPVEFEAMRCEGQARINALFAVHDARQRAQREAMWARDEARALGTTPNDGENDAR